MHSPTNNKNNNNKNNINTDVDSDDERMRWIFFCVYKALVKYINIILLVVVVVVLLSDIFFVTFRAFHIYIYILSRFHMIAKFIEWNCISLKHPKKRAKKRTVSHILKYHYYIHGMQSIVQINNIFCILRHIFSFTLHLWYELRRVSSEKNICKKK